MSPSMTIEEALRNTIDANTYFFLDPREQNGKPLQEFCMALELPFVRPDEKWEFRVLRLHASRIELKGEWDDDARAGWAIERVAFSPTTLEFAGDELSLLIHLLNRSGTVGSVAIAYLDQWPDSDSDEFSKLLSTLFADQKMEWRDLLPSAISIEYR